MEEDSIEKLYRKISKIEELLNKEYFEELKRIASAYYRLINIYLEHGRISPSVVIPELEDSLERDIVDVLFEMGEGNISEITEKLRAYRGKGSRNTVREKLKKLEEKGIVVVNESGGERKYRISSEYVIKWLRILGGFGERR